ncbi:hypothetical protein [Proteus mirabilis]|uniref:hypothetical protein n=1 Tax=Proteus mirabilis TaxID=584 RepID=UPI0007A64122|nr:hypothetical protein [Proteus mirabilis]EKT8673532.1 hypothetical protein [Proteus mirabilis]EKU9859403.1 hypothetical protein [Proteus mirabilis]ELO7513685.1 hypothetical protein [Proteus mirabilis]MBG3126882.1 hypothetical protein [Proteus mirabilis]MBI6244555.1 hypothetical protein [Proteus mirabilis]
MMDKSRQQFEEWINKNHPKCSGYHKDIRLEAWQASRDSLVLNLPAREKNKGNYDFFTDGYNSGISACEISLLDNGVKIKDE